MQGHSKRVLQRYPRKRSQNAADQGQTRLPHPERVFQRLPLYPRALFRDFHQIRRPYGRPEKAYGLAGLFLRGQSGFEQHLLQFAVIHRPQKI